MNVLGYTKKKNMEGHIISNNSNIPLRGVQWLSG